MESIIFNQETWLLVTKILLVVLLSVYGLFAMLMMRQIVAMTKAVQMQDDYIIRGLGILHFGFALVVWLMAVLISP